ncbi:Pycsar system effector family protein [Daejeonella lutea]|uniref:Predicted metal-dependent phosphohydrolase, HD superfamily n=1 Tax=Daejeonella lutea TaxID=572036 RepID=A0A1T5EN55_9SPHI|nr:Pycsar system effector family protein [Daejeonella lutea]SKB85421.1 Predicted metal-dependent phosphohydrolase, HD superfamily [Daejeonella lutea]
MKSNTIVKDAAEYVFNLFKDKLPGDYVYHNYNHTAETAKACKKLSKSYNLTSRDYEVLMLAAIFHDTGYITTYENHEEESVKFMKEYLTGNYSDEDISEIESLILSTKYRTVPDGSLQEILHDADYINLGNKSFDHRADLLRIEWERILQKTYTEEEWAQIQLQFLLDTQFKTEEAVLNYNEQKEMNILKQRAKIDKFTKESDKDKSKAKPVKDGRGIETLYRSVYDYHISLTSIADNKANMMISINTIIISIVITLFGTGFTFSSQSEFASVRFVFPMAFLLLTSLLAVVFAILSARPNVTTKEKYELSKKDSSILFFGNFAQLQLREFVDKIKELKQQKDELYESMSIDIYYLGSVLIRKYNFLSWSYNIFMFGMVICAVGFVIIMLFSY